MCILPRVYITTCVCYHVCILPRVYITTCVYYHVCILPGLSISNPTCLPRNIIRIVGFDFLSQIPVGILRFHVLLRNVVRVHRFDVSQFTVRIQELVGSIWVTLQFLKIHSSLFLHRYWSVASTLTWIRLFGDVSIEVVSWFRCSDFLWFASMKIPCFFPNKLHWIVLVETFILGFLIRDWDRNPTSRTSYSGLTSGEYKLVVWFGITGSWTVCLALETRISIQQVFVDWSRCRTRRNMISMLYYKRLRLSRIIQSGWKSLDFWFWIQSYIVNRLVIVYLNCIVGTRKSYVIYHLRWLLADILYDDVRHTHARTHTHQ